MMMTDTSLKTSGWHQAFDEGKLARVEKNLLAVEFEQQTGMNVFGDAHSIENEVVLAASVVQLPPCALRYTVCRIT
ncbi:hypothetical protein PK28_18025 (plasmid) [Hymenobacter sp. DG25B]|nr:hypothetical protein PK28_18025 [Hymenobacter sp. DG25B]